LLRALSFTPKARGYIVKYTLIDIFWIRREEFDRKFRPIRDPPNPANQGCSSISKLACEDILYTLNREFLAWDGLA
jgi:hypothetical protein